MRIVKRRNGAVQGTSDPASLRKLAIDLLHKNEERLYELGGVLREIRDTQAYLHSEPKYASWADWVEGELNYGSRKADYLISIRDRFENLGVGQDVVNKIGWTRAREIARVMTDKNKDHWLKEANEKSYREVANGVKSFLCASNTPADRPIGYLQIPMFTPEHRTLFEEVLELASRITGSDSKTVNFSALAYEFLGTYGTGAAHDAEAESALIANYPVLARDGFRCQNAECSRRVTLEAHHIIPRSRDTTKIDDPDNQLTLCADCHRKITDEEAALVKVGDKWTLEYK